MTSTDLAAAERNAFRSVVDTGLWDIMLASVVAMFAIAPLLSARLGDFWSSAIFLPFWAVVYLILHFVRGRFVVPRVGVVRFGPPRVRRLRRFGVILLAVNVVSLAVGAIAATSATGPRSWAFPIAFAASVLALFSLFAYAYELPRFFAYGVSIVVGIAVGEWLWRGGYVSHHGFPAVFGTIAIVIAATGIAKLARLLSHRPPAMTGVGGGMPASANHD